MRELPALLADTLRPLQDQRASQSQRLATYKETPLCDQLADHAILDLYRREVIGVQAIGHVSKAFDELPGTGPSNARNDAHAKAQEKAMRGVETA